MRRPGGATFRFFWATEGSSPCQGIYNLPGGEIQQLRLFLEMLADTYSAGTGSDERMKSEIFHIKGLTRLKHGDIPRLKVKKCLAGALLFVTFGGSNAPLLSAENTIKLLR